VRFNIAGKNTPIVLFNNILHNCHTQPTAFFFSRYIRLKHRLKLSGNVPELLLDANSISRVLINLVKNSTESMNKGRDLIINIATQSMSPVKGILILFVV
jgi:hypothetical protein